MEINKECWSSDRRWEDGGQWVTLNPLKPSQIAAGLWQCSVNYPNCTGFLSFQSPSCIACQTVKCITPIYLSVTGPFCVEEPIIIIIIITALSKKFFFCVIFPHSLITDLGSPPSILGKITPLFCCVHKITAPGKLDSVSVEGNQFFSLAYMINMSAPSHGIMVKSGQNGG